MGTITVTNTHDSGPGSLRNAVAPSPDESTESAGQDILARGDYSEISSYGGVINTGNGDDSVFRSTLGIINRDKGNDSITPFIDQTLGTNFITGGNGNDSITTFRDEGMGLNFITPDNGNDVFFATTRDRLIGTLGGNDTITYEMVEGTTRDRLIGTFGSNDVFSATTRDRLTDTPSGNGSSGSDGADTLRASYFGGNGSSESGDSVDTLLGGYSEPSRKTEQFHGFPGLSISGNNTSRVTSTGDGYSDDNNSLESDYRATLYGGTGEDLFNGRSDTSSPLPLPATNQSPGFTDTIEGKDDLVTGTNPVSSAGDVNGDGKDDLIIGTRIISTNIPFLLEPSTTPFSSQPVESGGISPLANESITLTSGASPVEVSLLLPAVQSAREAARFSGGSSSDGAWASR